MKIEREFGRQIERLIETVEKKKVENMAERKRRTEKRDHPLFVFGF